MNTLALDNTIGDIVHAAPIRARVFQKLGVDFCCGGKRPLGEVCRERGLDPAAVLAMLEALDTAPAYELAEVEKMGLAELCDHLEQVHHGYLRDELPRLDFMTRKVAAVHGGHEPRLTEIRAVFCVFSPALVAHVVEEEETIFPALRTIDRGGEPAAGRPALRGAMEKLQHEHAHAAESLARFARLTDGYAPPDWACNTFRALYDGLGRLEADLRRHLQKENGILFPRALALL